MIELIEFKCQGNKCSIKWKALPNCKQTHCSNCASTVKRWVAHDRELEAKKPQVKIEAKIKEPKLEIKKIKPQTQPRSMDERPSWNQRTLQKKFKTDPNVVKCSCGNYYKKRINQFGINSVMVIQACKNCGLSSDFGDQIKNL